MFKIPFQSKQKPIQYTLIASLIAIGMVFTAGEAKAKSFFVSPSGTNEDGSSWKKAWKELDQIDWESVQAGDSVIIDGGKSSISYHTRLVVPKSGAARKPIVITQSRHPKHSGQVVITGINNPISFPSGQPQHAQYPKHPPGVEVNGSNVYISGNRRCGIQITDYALTGLKIKDDTTRVTLNNLEIKKCGIYTFLNDFGGLVINGGSHRFYNLNVHDNNGRNVIRNRTGASSTPSIFLRCWIYNEDNGFSDGIDFRSDDPQSDGASARGLDRVYYSAVGPGLVTGVSFLGNAGGLYMAESLLLNAKQTNFTASSRNENTRFIVRNVTSFTTPVNPLGLRSRCVRFYGTTACYDIFFPQPNGRTNIAGGSTASWYISNSIFYGGRVGFNAEAKLKTDRNFQFNVSGNTTALAAELVDPQFRADVASIPDDVSFSQLANTSFHLSRQSPAHGSGSRYVKRASIFGHKKN